MPSSTPVGTPGGGNTNPTSGPILNQTPVPNANSATGGVSSQPTIGQSSNPPSMKTLVYSPDVRVVIAHGNKQYDVSSDIVRCSLHRAEDSAASFFMTLTNKELRYTPKTGRPVFSRMDRIVVYMKRTKMIQVFSGYLDSVPYKQLYPGTVDFKATCTVKRLMHTWWNPALPMSTQILQQAIKPGSSGDGQLGNGNDRNLGSMLRRLLVLVGGWKVENIHIQNFPELFFQFLTDQAKRNQSVNDKAVEEFKHLLLGDDISPGVGSSAGTNSNAGAPGPYGGIGAGLGAAGAAGTGTVFYIQQIIAACDERGLGPLVRDNNVSANQVQAGQTGEGSRDAASQKAFQQINQGALDAQNANRNSDAAIIGVATAAVETGGGVAIKNLSNPACPGSSSFPNDGVGTNFDSCGIFQQRNSGWGTVSQRMNPKQAAGMFFNAMTSKVPDWRNQDPGAVAQTVQVSNAPAKYSAAIEWATQQVKAVRTASSGPASTTVPSLGTGAGTSVPGAAIPGAGSLPAPSTTPNLTPGAPSISPTGAGVGGGLSAPSVSGVTGTKPNPDSEGAVQFMLSKVGNTPYVWGGHGPAGYDCSGLVSAAFASIGLKVPAQTISIRNSVTQIPKSQAGRGDIYEPESGHVTVLLGPPGTTLVQASTSNAPLAQQINVHNWYSEGDEWYGRACANGGPDPTSPYNPAVLGGSGAGTPPGATQQTAGAIGTGLGGGANDEQIARNLFAYMFTGQFNGDISQMWHGEKAFLDGQPLIQTVKAIANASLRKFQSAPNGDLMFYYPDWWGLDGKPAVYRMEDIELKDVRIDFSDDPLTTHVYVSGDYTEIGQQTQPLGWMQTAGVVTVEDTWIYARLIAMAPGDPEVLSGDQLMRRFGVRPLKQEYAMAGSHELEILLACQVFMEKWAQQFQTSISMTFMPELYPGMRIELAGHHLSVYVSEVTHICDFEGGFTTTATILAPANPNGKALMGAVSTPGQKPSDPLQNGFLDPIGGGNTTKVGG
jgi:hypothetical protein